MSTCPCEGCINPTKPGHLMCLGCWKMVPRAEQMAVNRTWRNYRREPEAYLQARATAIRTVDAKMRLATKQGGLF